jgi:hypothetical protein
VSSAKCGRARSAAASGVEVGEAGRAFDEVALAQTVLADAGGRHGHVVRPGQVARLPQEAVAAVHDVKDTGCLFDWFGSAEHGGPFTDTA